MCRARSRHPPGDHRGIASSSSRRAAHHADGQAAAECLAVGDEVGPDAEIFLRAAERQAEADEDLVEDQHDAALGADRAELLAANACRPRGRNAPALPLSTSVESAGAPAFGCIACSGLTSTQAMSRRVRSTCSVRSDISASV